MLTYVECVVKHSWQIQTHSLFNLDYIAKGITIQFVFRIMDHSFKDRTNLHVVAHTNVQTSLRYKYQDIYN